MSGFPLITSGSQISLPLASLGPTADDSALIWSGQWALIKQCVARFGVALTHPFIPESRLATYDPSIRYGDTDLSVAKTRGFGLYISPTQQNRFNPWKDSGWVASNDIEQAAFEGARADGSPASSKILDKDGKPIPQGGCLKNPGRTLYQSGADLHFAENLMNDGYFRAKADARVVAVVTAWSKCMQSKGYVAPTPEALLDHFDFLKPPTAQEVRTATADVQCKYLTNYLGVWNGVEIDVENKLIAAHETEIDQYRTNLARNLAEAKALVAQG